MFGHKTSSLTEKNSIFSTTQNAVAVCGAIVVGSIGLMFLLSRNNKENQLNEAIKHTTCLTAETQKGTGVYVQSDNGPTLVSALHNLDNPEPLT